MINMVSNSLLAQARRATAVWLLLLLSGCIPLYIPPFGSISAERLGEITVGSTTRQQVLELLGEPDKLKHENFWIYDLYSSKGTLGFVAGGFMGAGAMGFPVDTRYYRVLLEFNSQEIVKRYEIEEGVPQPQIFQTGGGVSPLPKGAEAEIKLILKGFVRGLFGEIQMNFRSVAFSPDGRFVAGATTGGRVLLWDTESGEQKMVLAGGGSFVRFSPDGKLLAAAGEITPTLWEFPSGAKKLSFEGHGSSGFFTSRDVKALAFSPDSKMAVSGTEDGSIKVWEAATGKTLKTFEVSGAVSSVAFSPDGQILAATSKEVILWELATDRELGRITAGSDAGACAFSPDGRLLAVATLSHVEIWKLPFDYHVDQPAHAESGRATAVRGREELVTIFLLPYVSPSFNRPSLVFSPDGTKVAASAAGAVIGDLSSRRTIFRYYPPVPLRAGTEYDFLARDVAISPDGKTVALATYGGVYLSDVPSERAAEGSASTDPSGIPGEGKK